MDLKFSGFEGVNDALKQLKLSQRRAAARRVLTEALQPVAEAAKRMAPVDDGQLRDSIVVSTNVTKAARSARIKDGVTVFAGTANRNGVPREFGTFRSQAHPFMRPAWLANRGQVLDSIIVNFGEEINRTIAKAAKSNRRKKK